MADLGECCACLGAEAVRTVIMLPFKAPIPGHGWGCVVCGLPADGAMAVLCDMCFLLENDPLWACRGYPATEGRIEIEKLTEPFEHDLDHHPEYEETPCD